MRRGIATLAAAMLATATPALAQETTADARAEGKAMAEAFRQDGSLVPNTEGQALEIPGYQGTTLPQSTYFDDPDKMVSEASAQTSSHEGYQTIVEGDRVRPKFDAAEIKADIARGRAIEDDPQAYLDGEDIGGGQGSCIPLPPSQLPEGWYEASCNIGTKLNEQTRSCTIPLSVSVEKRETYTYWAGRMSTMPTDGGVYPARAAFDDEVASGICQETRAIDYCGNFGPFGFTAATSCPSLGHTAYELKCSAPAQGITPGYYHPGIVIATGEYWLSKDAEATNVRATRNETACAAFASDRMCVQQEEICTSSDPVTRIVDGVAVTQPCWAWNRTYLCHTVSAGNDCPSLEANPQCTFVREECLDDDEASLGCEVRERIYRCPTPGSGGASDEQQYICGNDVYCLNGECETIEREASTELKDALVALHAIGQAGKEFNPDELTVFSGERETCHKPVFGLINCCAGKVSGVLTVGAGAAALAGGPAAIAALATPFLTLFACSTQEKMLDIKDRMGFCYRVGTYCSSSFLGICKTRRTAYCCFESKLSRILQEQGRIQLGKPWGKPKNEQCRGFSIHEFASLDLSKMDFTEVYAEFIDAAKLPDEVQTMSDIQKKIEEYYARSAPGGG